MALMLGHGTAKYVTGERLATSAGMGWPDILAERWRHSEGDLGEVVPRDTEVIVMLEGRLKVRRRGDGCLQHHDAVPGTVWLCPAGVSEDMIRLYGPIRDSVHLYVPGQPLSRAVMQELDLDVAHTALRYEGGFRDATIEAIAHTVAGALRDADPISRLLAETMSAALAVYLVRRYSNRPEASIRLPQARGTLNPARLGRVTALIEARLGEEITLADLAREASLSPFHFARCFKAATGMPPHRYLLERRLQRARDMLTGTLASLAEIAAACGFCSQAHLTSAFKRVTGVTPGAFRSG